MTVKDYKKETIEDIAKAYLAYRWVTLNYLAEKYFLSERTISNLLYRGIAENILSEDVANDVFDKIVYANVKGVNQRLIRWEKAFDERYALIEKEKEIALIRKKAYQKEEILDRIKLLKFQINNFSDSNFEEEDAPSLTDLKEELQKLELKFDLI